MRFLLPALLICFVSIIHAQSSVLLPGDYLKNKIASGKTFSEAETRRFADLGRLWGMIHYFNPKLHTGAVITDSLALQPIRILMADPSATGFRNAVEKMLKLADDGGTGIMRTKNDQPSLLFIPENVPPRVHLLEDSSLFIAFPTASAQLIEDPTKIEGLMPEKWEDAKAIIIDLRNARSQDVYADFSFLYDVMPLLSQVISGELQLPSLFERRVFHNGFVSQASTNPNIYSSGWQVIASAKQLSPPGNPPLDKPVAFIYNRLTHIDIIKQISILRATGLCQLVYEGAANSYPRGSSEQVMLTDSVAVNVRVSDFVFAGDQPLPAPDLLVERVEDNALNGNFIQQVSALLKAGIVNAASKSAETPASFTLPRPNRYADTLVPSADKRIFGLYNFWNAFHYFSPYKDGLDHNWDSVIHQYVPVFFNADDSLSYMLAVRSLASETQDCHGFVNTSRAATPARHFYGAWPPVQLGIINHKVYIVEMAKDSTQDLSQLKVGDEVTHIDGHSIEYLKEQWRHYIPTSNESTYERDVANYFTVGPMNSGIKITVIKNNKPLNISLKRNARWNMGEGIMGFNKKHKTADLLPGNIAYINMGSLRPAKVDSVMNAFSKAKAIIFDIRNYPQGTAWTIAPRLTGKTKKAVLFDKPFVNYEYLRGGEDQSTLKSAFTVRPAKTSAYNGKVIILCNRTTQSQAEYSIMMFQGAANVTVIGSQTAGADGNVTDVTLPGGYSITFSGLGIYYPDGTPTQRRGIKIDIQSKPTIKGLVAGKDEVLERALQYINTGK